MDLTTSSAKCSQCYINLTGKHIANVENRVDCPKCGSMSRIFSIAATDVIHVKSLITIKMKRPGIKRQVIESKIGDDLRHTDGKWLHLEQIVDRENNRYKKKLVDSETDEVLRDEECKLTDHQGYGDAKK